MECNTVKFKNFDNDKIAMVSINISNEELVNMLIETITSKRSVYINRKDAVNIINKWSGVDVNQTTFGVSFHITCSTSE